MRELFGELRHEAVDMRKENTLKLSVLFKLLQKSKVIWQILLR